MRHDVFGDEALELPLDVLDLVDDPPGLFVVKGREVDIGQVGLAFRPDMLEAARKFGSYAPPPSFLAVLEAYRARRCCGTSGAVRHRLQSNAVGRRAPGGPHSAQGAC